MLPDVPLKKITPPVALLVDPAMVQYLTVFKVASFIKRMVLVPAVVEVLVLVMIRSFVDPVAFTRPSMVTLSAPFKSINGAARLPVMDKPEVVG